MLSQIKSRVIASIVLATSIASTALTIAPAQAGNQIRWCNSMPDGKEKLCTTYTPPKKGQKKGTSTTIYTQRKELDKGCYRDRKQLPKGR